MSRRDAKQVVEALEAAGWTIGEPTKSGHRIARHRRAWRPITLSCSPSTKRYAHYVLTEARRALDHRYKPQET